MTLKALVINGTRGRYTIAEAIAMMRLATMPVREVPSFPCARKRSAQNGKSPLEIVKYAIRSKMFDHVPYSPVFMFLVSRSVKMRPVPTLIIWAAKIMRPEYWILILLLDTGQPARTSERSCLKGFACVDVQSLILGHNFSTSRGSAVMQGLYMPQHLVL